MSFDEQLPWLSTPLSRCKALPLSQTVHLWPSPAVPTLPPRQDNFFHQRLVSPTLEFHINGIILFCVQLLSLSLMIVRLIPIVYFVVELSNIPQYGYTTICLSVYLLIDVWVLSSFRLFELSYYKYSCTSLYGCVLSFFLGKYLPRNGITGSRNRASLGQEQKPSYLKSRLIPCTCCLLFALGLEKPPGV